MAVAYTNNATTTLSATITNSATSLSVASGAGAKFPSTASGDHFYITLTNGAGDIEIMKVTARSTDTFTVVRAQDGTAAQGWAAGDKIELRLTKAMLDDLKGERALSSHTHAAADITSGTFDNARVKWAEPGTIGSTTPSSGAFTTLSSTGNATLASSSGSVGIGVSPASKLHVYDAASAVIAVHGDATTTTNLLRASTDTNSPIYLLRKARGSIASPSAVATNDNAGVVRFQAYGGTNYRNVADIIASVSTYTSDTSISGALLFRTNNASTDVTERARITSDGRFFLGSTNTALNASIVNGFSPAASSAAGAYFNQTIPSATTSVFTGFQTAIGTAAASFTLGTLTHFGASQAAIGSGSSITHQHGFLVANTLIGATNNFGFYSDIPAATGRWNFYANGTADNYFSGNVGIGTSSPGSKLDVNGNVSASNYQIVGSDASQAGTFGFFNSNGPAIEVWGSSTANAGVMRFKTAGTERARIDSSGNVGVGVTPSGTYKLEVNGSISGTTLRSSVATGTAPLTVASTTAVTNLNADLLDGSHASAFALLTGASFTGDITTYRSGAPTTGVIYLGNSGTKYLFFDGTNYVMPAANLYVNGGLALTTSNYSSYSLPLTGGTMTGELAINKTTSVTVGTNGGSDQFELMNNGTGGCIISFHRTGAYAINMGLDTDNVFRLGGWSNGTNVYRWTSDTSGNFVAQSNVTAYSDIRIKKDLAKIDDALAKVESLTGYTFTRTDTGQRQTGLIAQDVQKVLPEAVLDDGERLSLAYGNLAGLLIEAIKELKSEVDALKVRYAA